MHCTSSLRSKQWQKPFACSKFKRVRFCLTSRTRFIAYAYILWMTSYWKRNSNSHTCKPFHLRYLTLTAHESFDIPYPSKNVSEQRYGFRVHSCLKDHFPLQIKFFINQSIISVDSTYCLCNFKIHIMKRLQLFLFMLWIGE